MSCSVNLVPTARLTARTRARRRNTWCAVCCGTAVLLLTAWGLQRIAASALEQLAEDVRTREAQRVDVQRRLVAADSQRQVLLNRLETIAAARRPQPWAHRLVDLTRDVPAGIFFTTVQITPDEEAAKAAAKAAKSTRTAAAAPPVERDTEQAVRLLGYALDHATLLELVNTLQSAPGWTRVELVRAAREPYGGGLAVAFELDCRTREGQQ